LNAPLRLVEDYGESLLARLSPAGQAQVLRWELTRECMRALARLDPEGQPAREEKLARIHQARTRMRKAAASQDRGPARVFGEPRVGFFRVRVGRRGPWVPASIYRECFCTINGGDEQRRHAWEETCDRFPKLAGEIAGFPVDDVCEAIWHANSREITELEYRALVMLRAMEANDDAV
jgi:hypothetical protein